MLRSAVALLGVIVGVGCAGVRQNLAMDAAAGDHDCPRHRVTLVRETTTPLQDRERRWRYDLMVCSVRRTYVHDPALETFREAGFSGAASSGDRRFTEFRQRQAQLQRIERTQVEVAEDEFTGEVRARMRTGVDWEDGERRHPAVFSVTIEASSGEATVAVASNSDGWRWRDCHDFHMLVDGERVELGVSEHAGRVPGGGNGSVVSERVSASVPPATLSALLAATSVRGRVCSDVFALRPEGIEGLREFRQRLDELDASRNHPPSDTADSAALESDAPAGPRASPADP